MKRIRLVTKELGTIVGEFDEAKDLCEFLLNEASEELKHEFRWGGDKYRMLPKSKILSTVSEGMFYTEFENWLRVKTNSFFFNSEIEEQYSIGDIKMTVEYERLTIMLKGRDLLLEDLDLILRAVDSEMDFKIESKEAYGGSIECEFRPQDRIQLTAFSGVFMISECISKGDIKYNEKREMLEIKNMMMWVR